MADKDVTTKVTLEGDASGLIAAMRSAEAKVTETREMMLSSFEMMGAGVEKAIGTIAAISAVVAGGEAFKKIVSETITWDLETGKLARTMGITTQQASVYKVAMHAVGIDQDVMAQAAMRMAKTLNTNSDAYKKIGVDIDGMRKSGASNVDIMLATIQALDQYKGGLDKNAAAQTIFGRSWGEMQQIQKMSPEIIEKAKEETEKYNMAIGPENVARAREYKMVQAELQFAQEAMAHAVGQLLLPRLIDLGTWFAEKGPSAVAAFRVSLDVAEKTITSLANNSQPIMIFLTGISAPAIVAGITGLGAAIEGLSLKMFTLAESSVAAQGGLVAISAYLGYSIGENIDRLSYSLAGIDLSGMNQSRVAMEQAQSELGKNTEQLSSKLQKLGFATWAEFEKAEKAGKVVFDQMSQTWKLQEKKTWTPPSHNSDWTAAHNKYLEYEKAFEAGRAAQVKAGNDLELELNRQAYTWGLEDLNTFLSRKKTLTLNSLDADIVAKQNDLREAKAALDTLEPVTDSKGRGNPSKDAENYHTALLRVQQAENALNSAMAKRKLTSQQLNDSDLQEIYKVERGYQEQRATLLDMQGDYVAAAAVRRKLDDDSQDTLKLIAAAMSGNASAQQAYWDREALNIRKNLDAQQRAVQEKASMHIAEMENRMAMVNASEKFYQISPIDAAQQRIDLLQQERVEQQAIYDSIQGNEPTAMQLRQQTIDKITATNEKLLEQQKIISDRTAVGGMTNALYQYGDAATNWGAQVQSATGNILQGMENTLTTFVTKGKLDFKNLADSIINDLARIAIQQTITGPLSNGLLGALSDFAGPTDNGLGWGNWSDGTPVVAGARAAGGPVDFGQTYLVGEKGPELFTPGASGVITPNSSLGGNGQMNITFEIVNQTGQQVKAKDNGMHFDGTSWIKSVILTAMDTDYTFRNAVRGGA